jgi:hypothetical protein
MKVNTRKTWVFRRYGVKKDLPPMKERAYGPHWN